MFVLPQTKFCNDMLSLYIQQRMEVDRVFNSGKTSGLNLDRKTDCADFCDFSQFLQARNTKTVS
jgi:hypothetical protein